MSAFQPFSVIYLDISMYAKKKTVTTGCRFIAFVEPPPPPIPQEETCHVSPWGKGSAASSRIVLTIDVSFKVWQAIFILITMKNLISVVIQPKWISTGSRYTSSVIAWD